MDGAIHRAAGPRLLEECRKLHGCNTGSAKITGGYDLPAAYVIHTAGPIWHGGTQEEDKLLADCYKNSLRIAQEYKLGSVAFPSISTGVYRFPVARASLIAISEILHHLEQNSYPEKVVFVCFDTQTYDAYREALLRK